MCIRDRDYPLYYDAMNEKGVAMAGLNFVGNAVYAAIKPDVENIAQFEFIPWILSQCSSLVEVRELLERINIVKTPFSEQFPLAPVSYTHLDCGGHGCQAHTGYHSYVSPHFDGWHQPGAFSG